MTTMSSSVVNERIKAVILKFHFKCAVSKNVFILEATVSRICNETNPEQYHPW